MGDRAGLTKLDRTNGFDDGRDYMRVKKSKLAKQNEEIRETLRSRSQTVRSEIFKGISVYVNGRTQPTADELKRLILLNGGDYHPYYRYKSTKFMIATNLSMARAKQIRPDDRVVRPEWITDSVAVKCLLPFEDYQLLAEDLPRETGGFFAIDQAHSSHQATLFESARPISGSHRSSSRQQSKKETTAKYRDIREMFTKKP